MIFMWLMISGQRLKRGYLGLFQNLNSLVLFNNSNRIIQYPEHQISLVSFNCIPCYMCQLTATQNKLTMAVISFCTHKMNQERITKKASRKHNGTPKWSRYCSLRGDTFQVYETDKSTMTCILWNHNINSCIVKRSLPLWQLKLEYPLHQCAPFEIEELQPKLEATSMHFSFFAYFSLQYFRFHPPPPIVHYYHWARCNDHKNQAFCRHTEIADMQQSHHQLSRR